MISLPEHIATIIEKHLKGLQSDAEMQTLQEWRTENKEHDLFYQQLSKLWKESGVVLEEPVYDTQQAWNKLDLTLKQGKKRFPYTMLLAACFTGILILAGWMIFRQQDTTILAAANQQLTLPDGSTVLLRKGASISYSQRSVTLSGAAYFDIKPDKAHPFRIQTSRGTIEVLGTSFLINSSQQYDRLVVTSGKVAFNKNIVVANQTAILDEKGFNIKAVKDSNYLSWQTGILKFDNEPISQVAAELSDYYNLPIKPDSGLAQYTITAKFDHQPVEEVLEEIKLLVNLSHRNQHDTILLFKP